MDTGIRSLLNNRPQAILYAVQAKSDMAAMMYKTAALLPEDLVPAGQQPLVLLDACIQEDRPIAVVRAGAAGVSAHAP